VWFGNDANDAFEFVWADELMVRDLDDATRQRALDGLRSTVIAHDTAEGVVYESAADDPRHPEMTVAAPRNHQ
jgi:hypothetical protein